MSAPRFLPLDDVVYGRAEQVSAMIRRVVAENPSKYTYRGTGTYLIGHGDVVVVDPGPRLESHRVALEQALAGERVRAILITHCHADHSPLAAWLRAETGAPTIALGPHPPTDPVWEQLAIDPAAERRADRADAGESGEVEESTDLEFTPDVVCTDGETVVDGWGIEITAVATPGHTSNHCCFALAQERALFTGDHVMGWSTTVVSPPDGDMVQYMASLRKVAERDDAVLWPTHGPPRIDAAEYVEALYRHRVGRERAVLHAVVDGHATIASIVELLYADVGRHLHGAARRSVWGHLIALVHNRQLEVEGDGLPGMGSRYQPVPSGAGSV